MQTRPELYARGFYRVVADVNSGADPRYLVVDVAGVPLRDEACFDAARAWVDARIACLDAAAAGHAHTPSRRGGR